MSDPAQPEHRPGEVPQAHPEDVNVRAIVRFAIALVLLMAVVHVALWGLFRVFRERAPVEGQRNALMPGSARVEQEVGVPVLAGPLPPEPRLEAVDQTLELLDAQRRADPLPPRPTQWETPARQRARLSAAAEWRPDQPGVARIPIERAMELVIEGSRAPSATAAAGAEGGGDGRR